jgi:preprotein translocase subunit SecA
MVLKTLVRKVFGDPNERDLRKYRAVVETINGLEAEMKSLSEAEMAAKTASFKQRLQDGETLDDILPEAFALVREASVRTINKRHYDVQLIGGMVLHDGKIAEMKTGEGKTLVATLPLYLNALAGEGAHLVTPNDYLSKFGLQSMGPIYHLLGLKAAVIQSYANDPTRGSFLFDPTFSSEDDRYQNLRPISRADAYAMDITYGTNNEFGFDYLRDNMVRSKPEMVQRGHYFAIVDEVDNILIDEARTPLIISGQADQASPYYTVFARVARDLKPSSDKSIAEKEPDGDYVEDAKTKSVYLTETGIEKVEKRLSREGLLKGENLYHHENTEMIPYLDNSLRAQVLFQRDKEYMVEKGQVVIVDEFTGRAMYGRRFSEGLHQAIEAKEGVTIQRENMTLATVTFQNYFRMYDKLGGMTGTALTEADEFLKIYKLEVVAIPTHLTVNRTDQQDLVYMTQAAKWRAIVRDIKERNGQGQPILVGTVAIETSEMLSKMLGKEGVKHTVLNAKQHEREAIIIAQAGRPGSVTIATNMAGRGVDILLGGNPEGVAREILRKQVEDITTATPEQWQAAMAEAAITCEADRAKVLAAGGLYVMGTERHEARRIDNQLRGRAGRQGDPGESRFYLSLEDDLMRRFGGDRVKNLMKTLRMPEDEPIEHGIISSSIQQAQTKIEGFNFDIRKRVLEYDDVVNKQREVIYRQRAQLLENANLKEQVEKLIAEEIEEVVDHYWFETTTETDPENAWQPDELYRAMLAVFPVPESVNPEAWVNMTEEDIVHDLVRGALTSYKEREKAIATAAVAASVPDGQDFMRVVEREMMLRAIDQFWVRHLTDLDMLREGVGLVAYAQRDPLVEYKREAYTMWAEMQDEIKKNVVRTIFQINVQFQQPQVQPQRQVQQHQDGEAALAEPAAAAVPVMGKGAGGPTNVREAQASISSYLPGGRGNQGRPAPNPVREGQAEPEKADMWSKAGRNDPCPCGSGKKFKDCHYRIIQEQKRLVDRKEVTTNVPKRKK